MSFFFVAPLPFHCNLLRLINTSLAGICKHSLKHTGGNKPKI